MIMRSLYSLFKDYLGYKSNCKYVVKHIEKSKADYAKVICETLSGGVEVIFSVKRFIVLIIRKS